MGLAVPVDETEAQKWYSAALAVVAEDDEPEKIDEARKFMAGRS